MNRDELNLLLEAEQDLMREVLADARTSTSPAVIRGAIVKFRSAAGSLERILEEVRKDVEREVKC